MPRFDKYEPLVGGFRARLAADWTADSGEIVAVGLDNAGRVVPGAGNTGIVGVTIVVPPVNGPIHNKAGDVVDVMTSGEILEVEEMTAGTLVFGDDGDGSISDSGDTLLGFTVEADRLVVRMGGAGGGGS